MNEKELKKSYYTVLNKLFNLLLIAFSVGGSISVYIGFAIFIIMRKTTIIKLCNAEKFIVIFYFYISITVLFSKSREDSLRYVFGFALILFFSRKN